MRTLVILIAMVFGSSAVYAQIPLTGKVFDLNTHATLPSVKVQNTRTRDNTQTNAAGIFTIVAKAGDVLVVDGFTYQADTVVVTNARYVEVYLNLKNNSLKEVKIQNTSTKLGSLKDPSRHNQPVVSQTDVNGDPIGGIALRFGYGKSSKEKKEEELAYRQKATQEIDGAFSADNVRKYVPLKDTALKQFVALYRPTIKQYKAPNFDLAFYLNDCYKKFVLLTPEERKLPRLKRDTTDEN
jgi:hypothetical protein